MVTSPGWGFEFRIGVYFFTTSFETACGRVARGYSRMYCPSIKCSVTENGNVDIDIAKKIKGVDK
jgi:hypothetical protein